MSLCPCLACGHRVCCRRGEWDGWGRGTLLSRQCVVNCQPPQYPALLHSSVREGDISQTYPPLMTLPPPPSKSFLFVELFKKYSKYSLEIWGNWEKLWVSPYGSAGKESVCNAGDLDLIPGLGRSPGEGNGYHSSILAWRIWGCKVLDTTEQLSLSYDYLQRVTDVN